MCRAQRRTKQIDTKTNKATGSLESVAFVVDSCFFVDSVDRVYAD